MAAANSGSVGRGKPIAAPSPNRVAASGERIISGSCIPVAVLGVSAKQEKR